jgi:hypothetical protein
MRRGLARCLRVGLLCLVSFLVVYAWLDPDATGAINIGPLSINLAMQGPSRVGFHYEAHVGRAEAGYTALPPWRPGQGMLPGGFAYYAEYEPPSFLGIEYRSYDRAHFARRPLHPNQPMPTSIKRSRHLWVPTECFYLIAVCAWGEFVVWKLREIDRRRGIGRRGFPLDVDTPA